MYPSHRVHCQPPSLHRQIEKMWPEPGSWNVIRTFAHLGRILIRYSHNIRFSLIPACPQVDVALMLTSDVNISWFSKLYPCFGGCWWKLEFEADAGCRVSSIPAEGTHWWSAFCDILCRYKLELLGLCYNMYAEGEETVRFGLDIDMYPINFFRWSLRSRTFIAQDPERNIDQELFNIIEGATSRIIHMKDMEVIGDDVIYELTGHSCATYGFIIKVNVVFDVRFGAKSKANGQC